MLLIAQQAGEAVTSEAKLLLMLLLVFVLVLLLGGIFLIVMTGSLFRRRSGAKRPWDRDETAQELQNPEPAMDAWTESGRRMRLESEQDDDWPDVDDLDEPEPYRD